MIEYFLMIGSPGRRQVKGWDDTGHHAGWLPIDSYSWATPTPSGAGRFQQSGWRFTRRQDEASAQLQLHCSAGTWFDLMVLDIWDGAAQETKLSVGFHNVVIADYQQDPDLQDVTFSISFEKLTMSRAARSGSSAGDPAPARMVPKQTAV